MGAAFVFGKTDKIVYLHIGYCNTRYCNMRCNNKLILGSLYHDLTNGTSRMLKEG